MIYQCDKKIITILNRYHVLFAILEVSDTDITEKITGKQIPMEVGSSFVLDEPFHRYFIELQVVDDHTIQLEDHDGSSIEVRVIELT